MKENGAIGYQACLPLVGYARISLV